MALIPLKMLELLRVWVYEDVRPVGMNGANVIVQLGCREEGREREAYVILHH